MRFCCNGDRAAQGPAGSKSVHAFTLIELLAVIAIIVLLMGILVPAVNKARDQAKNTKTLSSIKAISAGLELFRNDNEAEIRGYPPSRAADDPTESGTQLIFGAQWLVRYMMGKDLRGYVPKRNVPENMLTNVAAGWEQRDWYADVPTALNRHAPLPRLGPYVQPDGLKVVAPASLPNAPVGALGTDDKTMQQPVMLDAFGAPILYYAATPARGPGIASFEGTTNGLFTMRDNGMFTGLCQGSSCSFPPWVFGDSGGEHHIKNFGPDDPPKVQTIADDKETFPYYILNKSAFEATGRRSAVPYHADSFLLITAGKDGLYGTADDVTNF